MEKTFVQFQGHQKSIKERSEIHVKKMLEQLCKNKLEWSPKVGQRRGRMDRKIGKGPVQVPKKDDQSPTTQSAG